MQYFFTFLAPRNLNRTTLELFFSLNQRLSICPFGRRVYAMSKGRETNNTLYGFLLWVLLYIAISIINKVYLMYHVSLRPVTFGSLDEHVHPLSLTRAFEFSNTPCMIYEPVHEISNNVVCATSKASDQPAQTRSLTRAFASHLNILWL